MTKQTGLGAACWVDGVDLSGDVGSLQRINSARGVTALTGINRLAIERGHLHRDGGFEFSAWMNTSAGAAHPTLRSFGTNRIATYVHRASTLGTPAAACVCRQLDYAPSRPDSGELTWNVTAESNGYGLEWGNLLTPGKRIDTGATNGTGFDTTASMSFGLQAYLHAFALTGTDVTPKIQDSADNVTFADVTGATFTAVTSGATAQRIQTGRSTTVRRYLRVATTTSAGFTSFTFGVIVVKNTIATNF